MALTTFTIRVVGIGDISKMENNNTPNPTDTDNEELRHLVYEALTFVQEKDFFARKGTILPAIGQVEAIMQLITSRDQQIALAARLAELEDLNQHPYWSTSDVEERIKELKAQEKS